MCCEVIKSQIDLKVKEISEFPNLWGKYENLLYRVLLYPVIFYSTLLRHNNKKYTCSGDLSRLQNRKYIHVYVYMYTRVVPF